MQVNEGFNGFTMFSLAVFMLTKSGIIVWAVRVPLFGTCRLLQISPIAVVRYDRNS